MAKPTIAKADAVVANLGSIVLIAPRTRKAERWLERHCSEATWMQGAVVAEHRYAFDIVRGMQDNGLRVV